MSALQLRASGDRSLEFGLHSQQHRAVATLLQAVCASTRSSPLGTASHRPTPMPDREERAQAQPSLRPQVLPEPVVLPQGQPDSGDCSTIDDTCCCRWLADDLALCRVSKASRALSIDILIGLAGSMQEMRPGGSRLWTP